MVECGVTNSAGFTNCTFMVEVFDNEPPTLSCPSSVTVNADPGLCTAEFIYTAPVGMDNCTNITTSLIQGLGSGGMFPVGTTTEIYQSTDQGGNTVTCSFNITVLDATLPTISTQPQDTTVEVGSSANLSVVAKQVYWRLGLPGITDRKTLPAGFQNPGKFSKVNQDFCMHHIGT